MKVLLKFLLKFEYKVRVKARDAPIAKSKSNYGVNMEEERQIYIDIGPTIRIGNRFELSRSFLHQLQYPLPGVAPATPSS